MVNNRSMVVTLNKLDPNPIVWSPRFRSKLQVYHGPREALPAYIRSLGFHVPDQVNVQLATAAPKATKSKDQDDEEQMMDFADFLSEFLFLPHKALPVEGIPAGSPPPPLTSQELQDAWKKSDLYAEQMGMRVDVTLDRMGQVCGFGQDDCSAAVSDTRLSHLFCCARSLSVF